MAARRVQGVDHNVPMIMKARLGSWRGAGIGGRGARLAPAGLAGLVWLVAGLSAGYWVLQGLGRSDPASLPPAAVSLPQADAAAVARALGAVAPPAPAGETAPVAAPRYRLLGLVAQPGQRGAALIEVDGQPRPYEVGATLGGGLVLQSVDRRSVRLGTALDGPTTLELSLPATPP